MFVDVDGSRETAEKELLLVRARLERLEQELVEARVSSNAPVEKKTMEASVARRGFEEERSALEAALHHYFCVMSVSSLALRL